MSFLLIGLNWRFSCLFIFSIMYNYIFKNIQQSVIEIFKNSTFQIKLNLEDFFNKKNRNSRIVKQVKNLIMQIDKICLPLKKNT